MDLTFIQLFHSIKVTAEKLNKEVTFNVDLSDGESDNTLSSNGIALISISSPFFINY